MKIKLIVLPFDDRPLYICIDSPRSALSILAISWIEDANFQASGVHNFPPQLIMGKPNIDTCSYLKGHTFVDLLYVCS